MLAVAGFCRREERQGKQEVNQLHRGPKAEATAARSAAKKWTKHVTDVANQTLLPKANHSWYLGANIPGKPRVFMPYANGLNNYRIYCDKIAKRKYQGFVFKGSARLS